jgi:ribosomal-protein-alanine N-acetyltransferase
MKREVIYKIFSNLPIIHTERLTLRKMKVSDTDDMFEYASRRDVTRYLTWYPHRDRSYTKEYLEYLGSRYATGDFYDWAVTLDSEGGKMIGTCGFTRFDPPNNCAEIGYVINPAYHHMGIATEAAAAVIRFGFRELGLHRIEARFMKGNEASLRVMERLGMTFEGELRDALCHGGTYKTVGICSIINEE